MRIYAIKCGLATGLETWGKSSHSSLLYLFTDPSLTTPGILIRNWTVWCAHWAAYPPGYREGEREVCTISVPGSDLYTVKIRCEISKSPYHHNHLHSRGLQQPVLLIHKYFFQIRESVVLNYESGSGSRR
jgi:hypothetical protein